MLTINDLKPGVIFLYQNQPYKVLDASHLKVAQSAGMLQAKIKSMVTGNTISTTFKSSDTFEEAEVRYETYCFVYSHRGQFRFTHKNDPKNRIALDVALIGNEQQMYLKPNAEVTIIFFENKPIGIELPIKMDFKAIEAPPSIKGNTAQRGTKTVTIETGAKIQTPMFIETGDVIRVNTQTGEYTERVAKAG